MDPKQLTNRPITLLLIFLLAIGYGLNSSDLKIWGEYIWIVFFWMSSFMLLVWFSVFMFTQVENGNVRFPKYLKQTLLFLATVFGILGFISLFALLNKAIWTARLFW